ncbi:hypothetical protein BDU57DRAFT_449830 [Ampelomyces quisqualis]|uniref:Structure-specific endonuclease subunit SLX4 n=1 Tax=Ampelomyces quisqualis TaxID=50730 RepID=A0A6A5QNZ1_AMPQU|nr:hypothetical protein BDU57DRAFT_449830 [Ampelomyces quisqualis]
MAGTPFEIVVLSSSPPAHHVYAPSSPLNASPTPSPRRVARPAYSLPALSPPASPQKKASGASPFASRKAAIPPDAMRGFATVSSLVRSEHFAQLDDDVAEAAKAQSRSGPLEDARPKGPARKNPRKPRATASAADEGTPPKPKPRSRKPKATDKEVVFKEAELRAPPTRKSPYFPAEGAEPAIEPPNEPVEAAPKLTKTGKPRKPRAKQERATGADGDVKPKKARVTKPKATATTKTVGKAQREDACIESAHFRKPANKELLLDSDEVSTHAQARANSTNPEDGSIWDVPHSPKPKKQRPIKQRPPQPIFASLDLDEAVSRRRDWTPPRDTAIPSPLTDSVGKENNPSGPDLENGRFTHMISNFAYAQAPNDNAAIATTSTKGSTAVMKRRRVELVDVPGNQTTSRNSSPEKGKAPKKKPRTITDIATEQYQPRDAHPDPSEIDSEFFRPRTTVTKVPFNDSSGANGDAPLKKPIRRRPSARSDADKGGTKTKSKKASAKSTTKSKPLAEKLLSPGSALMRLSKQDILFGTSSQLALEESPTLVRQLQAALKESEVDAEHSHERLPTSPPHWPKFDKTMGKRSLWDASSRDVEGGLLEQMEEVYIPEFDRTQDYPLLMDRANDEPTATPPPFLDIDAAESDAPVVISSDLPTPLRSTPQASRPVSSIGRSFLNKGKGNLTFEGIDDLDSQPPPSNQNAESQNGFVDIDDLIPASAPSKNSPLPNKRSPTHSLAVGSPKKRGRPPKSQSEIPLTRASPARPAQSTKTSNAKQIKGISAPPETPEKGSGRFIDIDEIFDSEEEFMQALSPTPPRIRHLPDSQALPLFSRSPSRAKKLDSKSLVDPSVVRVYQIPAAQLEWANYKSHVFATITAHVRSLPPTTDPKKPSWHEKILMYDAIVLEEFTAYLNAKTRARTWRRATKVQTKAWNKGMREIGEEEVFVAEGGNEVLAVEKDLEASQVQAWCESMSVCCIWGEGRGKGGVRKGFY